MNAACAFVMCLLLAMASPGDLSQPPVPRPATNDAGAAPDITLKTRIVSTFQTSLGLHSRVRTEAVYLTSGRERRDTEWAPSDQAPSMSTTSIRDCTQHRWIMLAHESRTYNIEPFPDVAAQQATAERIAKVREDIRAGRIRPKPSPPDAPVTTIETIDTGERRELAGLTLRHLRQTETTTYPNGISGRMLTTRSERRDGWYATLPEVRECGEVATNSAGAGGYTFLHAVFRNGIDVVPRIEFKGNIPPTLGTAVEETQTTVYGDGSATHVKTELVELSRVPVNPSLFEVPPGYREALHTPGGGRDMMQPDTLLNRARAWWQRLWPG